MKYRRKELTKTESRRIAILLLNAVVIAGITAGSLMAVKMNIAEFSENPWLHQYFNPVYSGNTVLEVFKNTLYPMTLYLTAVFVLGFCSVGQPVAVALLIYKGMGIGLSAGAMYVASGAQAIIPVIALVVPKALAVTFIAVLSARESMRLSGAQLRFLFRQKIPEEKMSNTLKLYCIKFIVLMLFAVAEAVADSLMNYIFIDLY